MAAFIKLGDIKGEFSPSREAHVNRFTTGGGGDSLNAWRDLRHGPETFEGFVIPTDGDDIVRGEFASKANAYVDGAVQGFQSDALTSGGQEGFTWEAASDIWTNGGASTFNADALVQQVNGTIGYEMQPDEYFSHNPEWFAPGSAVDSWIEKSFGTGDGEHTFGGISQGNAFAPVNELRSDNRF